VALLSEAAACASRSGVSFDVFVDVLAKGGGGGTALERIKPYLLAGDPSGLRFTIANACKDLGYYNEMAGDLQVERSIAAAVLATLDAAAGRAGDKALVPELASILAQR
jgi:3-hydroxyisobutyrate dehydrogenase-like beta-hydroxyacid dehydrogenase